MTNIRIPVAAPDLTGSEEAFVVDALRSTWISSTGPYLERFEREFTDRCGVGHTLAVSNGTVALHLALLGLQVGPGDEVIVPSLTYVATANAVRYVGATPVFADVDPNTWCLSPEAVSAAVSERTKGIIAVHLYGHPADMDALGVIASQHGLFVVEDAAEAPLARYKGRTTGSLGTVATFSFYGNKVITSGEGGAVTVSDDALADRMRLIRGQGMDPQRRYFFPVTGHNFRLTNVAAAMLCAQLARADQMVARRLEICARYSSAFRDCAQVELQPVADWAEVTPWLFSMVVRSSSGLDRDGLMAALQAAGIETRPFFIPLHRLPPFQVDSKEAPRLPVTDHLSEHGLNLPTSSAMSDEQVDEVIEAVLNALRCPGGSNA